MFSKLILLVEDTESQAKVLKKLLESRGFSVVTARSFFDLKELLDSPDLPELFLSICDVNLPDAPHGEAIDWLLEKDVNTIVYTANISDTLKASMTSRSIIDYVLKEDASSLIMLAEQCETLWQNRQLKALLIEDTPSSAEVMKHLLVSQQFQVEVAQNGAEALEKAKAFEPDLVVVDLILPDVSGAKLTRQLKTLATDKVISIVGVSVNTEVSSTIGFIKNGANDFIAKPFTPEEFICRINQIANLLWHNKKQAQQLEQHHLMNQMLSHDIRSPVSMMISGVKLLSKRYELNETDQQLATSILHSGHQVIDLLEDALNLHELGVLNNAEKESVDLHQLIIRQIEGFEQKAHNKSIAIKYNNQQTYRAVSSKNLLGQCIGNVIDNALKYSPKESDVLIDVSQQRSMINIAVVDQGPGLMPEDLPKLFSPFAKLSSAPTAGETSTGLGLSIVKRILRLLEGDINYEPAEGGGSKFIISIPTAF